MKAGFDFLAHAVRLVVEQELDAALARRGLAPLTVDAARDSWRSKTALQVITAVATSYDIPPAAIIAPGRTQPAAEARQVAAVLLRRIHGFSRSEAIRAIGRTDPTLYWTSEGRVTALAAADPEFRTRLLFILLESGDAIEPATLQAFHDQFHL
jgi:chromosomal replication initiation ATPase DnaA